MDSMETRALQEEVNFQQEDSGCSGEARDGQFPSGIHDNHIRLYHNELTEFSTATSGGPSIGASAAQMAMLAQGGGVPPRVSAAQMAILAQESLPREMLSSRAPLLVQALVPSPSRQTSPASLGREAVPLMAQALEPPPAWQALLATRGREAVLPTAQKPCIWEPNVQQQLVQALMPATHAGLLPPGPCEQLLGPCDQLPLRQESEHMFNMVQAIPAPVTPGGSKAGHYQLPQEQIAMHRLH